MVTQIAQPNIWAEPVEVKRGDLFALGKHRLLCGDSTNAEDVARLFAGERFTLCFTSPPYSDQRTYTIGTFDWHSLMCGAFEQIVKHGKPDCHILINLGLSHKNRRVDMYWLGWLMQCAEMGWPLFGWYVWDKGSVIPRENDGRLFNNHEFVFHFNCIRNGANKWVANTQTGGLARANLRQPDGTRRPISSPDKLDQPFRIPSSTIHITKECTAGIHNNHPAVFPVALPEFIYKTWSQSGDIVYEPFCGSGTSIIAGENLGRRVYACEIAPEYVALAIERWQTHTGQKAVKM